MNTYKTKLFIIGLVSILSVFIGLIGCDGIDKLLNGSEVKYERFSPILEQPINPHIKSIYIGYMKVTSYRSVPEQTDNTPFITADGYFVHGYGIAISRDLHKRWGGPLDFGDIVYIDKIGFKVINDVMNKRHNQSIDIWVKTYEQEKNFHTQFKGQKLNVWKIGLDKNTVLQPISEER